MKLSGVVGITLLVLSSLTLPALADNQVQVLNSLTSVAELSATPVSRERMEKAAFDLRTSKSSASDTQKLLKAAFEAGLKLQSVRLPLDALKQHGGFAVLRLRNPDELVVAAAIGSQSSTLYDRGIVRVVSNELLGSRYTQEALVATNFPGAKPKVRFDNPVRVVKITSSENEVAQTVSITNRGSATLSLDVERTSCGCTDATLSKKLLAPGEVCSLQIKMTTVHWGNKTETVTLRTNDPAWPRIIVALQAQAPTDSA